MNIKTIVYTTSRTNWFSDDFDFIRETVSQTKGAELSTITIEHIDLPENVPTYLDPDGNRKPSWAWFEETFAVPARARGCNAACWHLTKDEQRTLGLTGYNGFYNNDPDDVLEFFIICDKGQKARHYPYSEFTRLFLHELGHGFERWLYGRASRLVHTFDYEKRLLHEVYREFDATAWNVRFTLRNVARTLRDLLLGATQKPTRYPTQLAPAITRRRDQLLKLMETVGHPITVTEDVRSCARQNELYAQGRSTDGQIVTNARCGESLHQYGVAFDVAFLKDGKPSWSEEHPWGLLGMAGESLGLEWGGRWTAIVDRPHFQFTGGYSLADFQAGRVDLRKLS